MDKSSALRQSILDNGWRQGSLIRCDRLISAANEMGIEIPDVPDRPDAYLILVSTSCDVVYGDKGQLPCVEAQLCFVNPKAKNTNAKVTDPRKMVLSHEDQKLDIHMKGATALDRELLSDIQPDSILDEAAVNSLIRWKVAHYNRLALPETLVERIGSKLRDKEFLKWVKRNSDYLEGIFLEVRPLIELDRESSYELGVICVVDFSKMGNEKNIPTLTTEFDELLVSPLSETLGINLLNESYPDEGLDSVLGSNDFTYDLLKRFRRYPLDHFSLDPELNDAPISV